MIFTLLLFQTLVEAKPTLFFGVPRVYEKIQEKMMEVEITDCLIGGQWLVF